MAGTILTSSPPYFFQLKTIRPGNGNFGPGRRFDVSYIASPGRSKMRRVRMMIAFTRERGTTL